MSSTIDVSDLPALGEDHSVTPEQVESFRRDGHVTLRGVCSEAEIALYRPHICAAVQRLNEETRPLEQRDTYGRAFLQVWNIWVRDAAVARFVLADRKSTRLNSSHANSSYAVFC